VQQQAATCVAEDRLTDAEIALGFGITPRTLQRWKEAPKFRSLVDGALRQVPADALADHGASVQARIKVLEVLWDALDSIVQQRAHSPRMESIPGGTTGYLRPYFVCGSRPLGYPVVEYRLDTSLLDLMCRLEVEAAQATGDWQQPLRKPEEPLANTPLANGRQERAAWLMAEGETDVAIARACGVNRRTVLRWKQSFQFHDRIRDLRALRIIASGSCGIMGDKRQRLARLTMRYKQLWTIVGERAQSPEMQNVPGGKTGMLTVGYQRVGRGRQAILLREETVDHQLMRQMRKHLAQAANEVGDWELAAQGPLGRKSVARRRTGSTAW
jgi:hypothetical protein